MKVGLFDPPEDSPWTNIGLDDLNSTHSQGVAYEAALQGVRLTHIWHTKVRLIWHINVLELRARVLLTRKACSR